MALGPLPGRERIAGRHARVTGAPLFCAPGGRAPARPPGAPRSSPAIGDAGEEVVAGVGEAGVQFKQPRDHRGERQGALLASPPG
jgi:hypothetical protein